MSYNCFVYLDDGISGICDYIATKAASNTQCNYLVSVTFVNNEKKNWTGNLFKTGNGLVFWLTP